MDLAPHPALLPQAAPDTARGGLRGAGSEARVNEIR